MDIIYLRQLRVDALIGVWDWERCIRQTLIMDIELGTDMRAAGGSDDLADTVDYQAVCDRITSFTRESDFHLIEALGAGIVDTIRREFEVPWMRLSITKQGVLKQVREVGIVIERGDRGTGDAG